MACTSGSRDTCLDCRAPVKCPIISEMEQGGLVEDVKRLMKSLGPLPEPVVKPSLVVISGLPGTGKSYFCRRLAERAPLGILESDVLRKVIFPIPTYASTESLRLFRACYSLVEVLLKKGVPLALDATNLGESYRERLYHICDQVGARLIIVRIEAPPEVVRQRLEKRAKGADAEDNSEADWRVYQRMRLNVDRIRRNHLVVDTARDITPIIDKIVREVNRR